MEGDVHVAQPLVSGVGDLVRAVGNTVTNAGGLVNPGGANGAVPVAGLVTSVVGGMPAIVHNGSTTGTGGTGDGRWLTVGWSLQPARTRYGAGGRPARRRGLAGK